MKKRTLLIALAMVLCLAVGAAAANGLQEIKAYLDQDITVKYDGQAQAFTDANGKTVYPISYNGTTYLPVRAISGLLGIDVGWEQATRTVLLGKTGVQDFIDSIEPYAIDGARHWATSDNMKTDIAGKTYKHWIELGSIGSSNGKLYYDLGGKYETLSFDLYNEYVWGNKTYTVSFYGDNDALLAEFDVVGGNLPERYEVDVTGVQQLVIKGHESVFLFNATIE